MINNDLVREIRHSQSVFDIFR